MCQLHPFLGNSLVAKASATRNGIHISHNSLGWRGGEFEMAKKPGRIRVVAVGGSSTYCVGVSDEFTWPSLLQDELGSGYEVINLGCIGHSSVEHLILTALLFSDLKPDIAIYYCGWNDLHVQHIANLKADYSDFHGKAVMSIGLGGSQREGVLASVYFIKRILLHWFFAGMEAVETHGARYASPNKDAFTDRVDQRALDLWERDLKMIAELCKFQSVRPIFVPQVMNWEVLLSDYTSPWSPYVRDRDHRKIMGAYYRSMERVAKEEGVAYAAEVLEIPFSRTDFLDSGHFSRAGNQRFAQALAKRIKGE
jgi:lysophospholipase L1-like esterase